LKEWQFNFDGVLAAMSLEVFRQKREVFLQRIG